MLSQTKFYNRVCGQLFKLHLGISHTKLANNLIIRSFKMLNLLRPFIGLLMYYDNTVMRLLYSIVYEASIIRLLMATISKSSSTAYSYFECVRILSTRGGVGSEQVTASFLTYNQI